MSNLPPEGTKGTLSHEAILATTEFNPPPTVRTNNGNSPAPFIMEITDRGGMAIDHVPGRLAVTRIRGREECMGYIERRYRWLANMMGGAAALRKMALDIVFEDRG